MPIGRLAGVGRGGNRGQARIDSSILPGTAGAVIISATYEPTFSRLASVIDALDHTTTLSYDARGNLIGSTDALGHTTTYGRNSAGQLTAIPDANRAPRCHAAGPRVGVRLDARY